MDYSGERASHFDVRLSASNGCRAAGQEKLDLSCDKEFNKTVVIHAERRHLSQSPACPENRLKRHHLCEFFLPGVLNNF